MAIWAKKILHRDQPPNSDTSRRNGYLRYFRYTGYLGYFTHKGYLEILRDT